MGVFSLTLSIIHRAIYFQWTGTAERVKFGLSRKAGRVAQGAALEKRLGSNPLTGSNPVLSAKKKKRWEE